jgi:hypothetical protein
VLLTKKKELTEEEQKIIIQRPEDIFDANFEVFDINGQLVNLVCSPQITYFNTDLNPDLLQDEDYEKIATLEMGDLLITRENINEFVEDCKAIKKAKHRLAGDMLLMHNYICWMSLRRKAHLMIQAYRDQIIPRIVEVHEIQREVRLESPNGNYIIGFIDFEATLDDGIRYIIDNKTASKPYKENAVEESQQLAIYSEFAQNRNYCYIVIHKTIKVKEPRVSTQIIKGVISEELLEKVFDTVGEVCYNIEEGNFERNTKSCFAFGQKCPYFAYCKNDLNMDGLVQLQEEKKE